MKFLVRSGILFLVTLVFTSCLLTEVINDEGEGTDVAGSLFTAAKTVINAKCVSCHGTNGGVSFYTDADIVARAGRIKDRAVDRGDMPPNNPLTADEKKKINDWVTNGGRLTN